MAAGNRAATVVAVALVLAACGCGSSKAADEIVFSASPDGTSPAQLFSIEPSGAGLKQLTTGADAAIDPAFSPSGERLAFVRSGVGIFTAAADGTGLHRLTTDARDSYPTWSPSGRGIAFIRPVGKLWRLYVVASTGGAPRELSKTPAAGRPSWTTTGLLVPTGADLLRVDPRTGRVLKYYGATIDAVWGLNTVTLSPNVSTLTYVGARAPEPGDMECAEGPCQRFGLFIESLVGRKRQPKLIVKDSSPAAFSPDGKELALVSGGKLAIRSVTGDRTTMLSTGTAYPTGTAPPAWR